MRWLLIGTLVLAMMAMSVGAGVPAAEAQEVERPATLLMPLEVQMLTDQYQILKEESLTLVETVKRLQQERQLLLEKQQQLEKTLATSQKSREELENQYVSLAETLRGVQEDRGRNTRDQGLAQKMVRSLEAEVGVLKRRQAQLDEALKKTDTAYRIERAKVKEAAVRLDKMQSALKAAEEERTRLQMEVVEMKSLAREARVAFTYELGRLYARHGEYNAAVGEFQKTLGVDPTYAEAYRSLGEIYREHLLRADLASPYFQRYIELRPEAEDFGAIRGWLLKTRREIEAHRDAAHVGGGVFHNLVRIFF